MASMRYLQFQYPCSQYLHHQCSKKELIQWGFLFFFPQDGKPVKKWVNMSQEFINQHTVEHKGKQICKYFLEGRCIKVNLIIFKINF